MAKGHKVLKPKFIPIEEVLKLKGIIAVGGDALKDSERIYDFRLCVKRSNIGTLQTF